jgi:plasmid stabilization system protein ParE
VEYEVTLSTRAGRDLSGIWLYLRDQDSEVATKYCLHLLKSAYSLESHPARNPRLPGLPNAHN